MYEQEFALNNLQCLIWSKTLPTNQLAVTYTPVKVDQVLVEKIRKEWNNKNLVYYV